MRPRHRTGPADLEGHGRLRRRAGELLRQRRLAAGISQDRLASATNLSQALISRVERGLHPASLDVLERLFEGLDLDLHVEAKPVHADLDREISRLSRLTPGERLNSEGWAALLRIFKRYGLISYVIEGALAALVQGAPLPVDEADIAVTRSDLAEFEAFLLRSAAMPWDERRQEYAFGHVDLRVCDTMRWFTGLGKIRVRFADSAPAFVEIRHDNMTYRVRPLPEVEVVDGYAAAMLRRYRDLLESSPGSTPVGIMAGRNGGGGDHV